VIRNDNSDYRDRGDNFVKFYCTMLHTTKSESWERSSNTNSGLMVVELEVLLASQARIMKYRLMDKFLSIELEENICFKRIVRQP
jgi:cytochrome c1